MCSSSSRVMELWRTLSRWIYLLLYLNITGVMSETCVYKRKSYNTFTTYYDMVLSTRDCQWGCCYNTDSPCCIAPISLIVGVALGGVLIFALIIATVCCCCVCPKTQHRRRQRRTSLNSTGGQSVTDPSTQVSVIYQTETSRVLDLPPDYFEYNELPPSYEEVMRGETNHAFKAETSETNNTNNGS